MVELVHRPRAILRRGTFAPAALVHAAGRWWSRFRHSLHRERMAAQHSFARLFDGTADEAFNAKEALHSAGISLTDHRFDEGVAVVSGKRADLTNDEWLALASGERTIVALDANSITCAVAVQLLRHGRKAQTPVAFVQSGGHASDRIEVVSLGDVALTGCPLAAPAAMIIGEVAGMARMAPALA